MQVFTRESEHSSLSDSGYAAAMSALDAWVTTGEKPTPASVAGSCPGFDAVYGSGCFLDPAFTPSPYDTRVAARPGGRTWPTMTADQERAWSRIPGIGIAP